MTQNHKPQTLSSNQLFFNKQSIHIRDKCFSNAANLGKTRPEKQRSEASPTVFQFHFKLREHRMATSDVSQSALKDLSIE